MYNGHIVVLVCLSVMFIALLFEPFIRKWLIGNSDTKKKRNQNE
jgi:hypothetical protein